MSMSLTVVKYLGLYRKEKERPDLVSVSHPPSLSKEEHADDIGHQMQGDDRPNWRGHTTRGLGDGDDGADGVVGSRLGMAAG
jgi:hypothetical protein